MNLWKMNNWKPSIWFDAGLTMNSWRFKKYANVFFIHIHSKCIECGLRPMAIYGAFYTYLYLNKDSKYTEWTGNEDACFSIELKWILYNAGADFIEITQFSVCQVNR